jgi:LAGLIDADG endonuclease
MSSDNPIGADDQQETRSKAFDPGWVVGFTDGEGCFSVSIHRNDLARPTRGWHVQPTFQVSQHADHSVVLGKLRDFFSCGSVRKKGPRSSVEVYVVHSTIQLVERVIPFFEEHELRIKRDDFEKFADIVRTSSRSSSPRGIRSDRDAGLLDECERQTAEAADRGNPPGILRDCTRGAADGSAVKIQSGPHGDMRSQTEMIWPPALSLKLGVTTTPKVAKFLVG